MTGIIRCGVIILLLLAMMPVSAGLAAQPVALFCLQCGQPYTMLAEDEASEGVYWQLENLRLTVLGIDFTFVATDDQVVFSMDMAQVVSIIEALDTIIPETYRRQRVDSVTILLSSEQFTRHYDDWTPEQQQALTEPYAAYFTSERRAQNVAGACTSFPGNDERERVIWLPLGKSIGRETAPSEHTQCAYSYHLYGAEGTILTAALIHELVHALTLTVTMPSLEDYGFAHNVSWEWLQEVTYGEVPELRSVEALAYEMTLKVLEAYPARAVFATESLIYPLQRASEVITWNATN